MANLGHRAAGPRMHRLCILQCRLAPKGGCKSSTCRNLGRRSVPRSVGGLLVYDSGPMDPRPLHPILWFKPTSNGRLRWLVEELPRINDTAGPLGTPGGTLLGLASVACGPLASLPCLLASLFHFLHHFTQFLLYFLHTNKSPCTSRTR